MPTSTRSAHRTRPRIVHGFSTGSRRILAPLIRVATGEAPDPSPAE